MGSYRSERLWCSASPPDMDARRDCHDRTTVTRRTSIFQTKRAQRDVYAEVDENSDVPCSKVMGASPRRPSGSCEEQRDTKLENSSTGGNQSNGAAESTVREAQMVTLALKVFVEEKLGDIKSTRLAALFGAACWIPT